MKIKKLFLFVLTVTARINTHAQTIHTAPANYNDAQSAGLKGKVKSVLELSFKIDDPDGKGDTIKCTYYDINGQIVKIRKNGKERLYQNKPLINKMFNANKQLISYNQNGKKYVLRYDSDNQLTLATERESPTSSYITTTYDKGKIVKNEEYADIGGGKFVVIDLYTYKYTESGYEITMSEQNTSGQYRPREVYTYDTHNNLIMELFLNPHTDMISHSTSHYYRYDDNGNVVVQSDEFTSYYNEYTHSTTPQILRKAKSKFIVDETGNWLQMVFESHAPEINQDAKALTKRVIAYYN